MDFNLTESISAFKSQEGELRVLDSLPVDFDLEELLFPVIPLPNSPLNILDDETFNNFSQLLHHVHLIGDSKRVNIIYQCIIDCIKAETRLIENEGNSIDAFDHKLALNKYGYLIYITVAQLTSTIDQYSESVATLRKKKGNQKSTSKEAKQMKDQRDKLKQPLTHFINLMSNVCQLLHMNLISIFQTQIELSTFMMHAITNSLTCSFKTAYIIKEKESKIILQNYICLCAKNQQQNDQISQMIIHHIKLSENLPEFMAETLTMLVEVYDNKHVFNDVLTELSEIDLTFDNSSLNKHISLFLLKLSEGIPSILIDYDQILLNFIGPSPIIRSAIIQSYQNIISFACMDEEYYNSKLDKINSIFDLIHSRLFDSHFNVRQKCLNLIDHILRLENKKVDFKEYRLKWVTIGTQFLEDKTTYSRKAALSLLSSLIFDHKYSIDGQRLSWSFYWNNYMNFTKELKQSEPDIYNSIRKIELDNFKRVDEEGIEMEPYYILKQYETDPIFKIDDDDDNNNNKIDDFDMNELNNKINELILKRAFCRDACTFIGQIHKSVELSILLFNSKSKIDAINAMDYFVILDAFGIETAKQGIKQMVHLVWRNGSNEDDIKILHKLIECYILIFLKPPTDVSKEFQSIYIGAQLISLTYNCNEADLISLGKLIYEIFTFIYPKGHENEGKKAELINDKVIGVLWKSFTQPKYEKEKIGSIIILTMLADADNQIILKKLNELLEFGLGNTDENKIDLSTIYSCIALRKSIPENKKDTIDYSLAILKLKSLLLHSTDNGIWFHLAEESLTTLYEIDSNANETTSEILKLKAMSIFGDNSEFSNENQKLTSLSQFIFLLGHIGIKTIVYLEKCEAEFKKRKIQNSNDKDEQEIELEMIGGSNEDDFSEVIQNIRDKELLYGKDSLLAKFVPLILEILTNRKKYPHKMLQRQSTLTFGKFMCISPFFCEQNLDLYIKLTRTSNDKIIRSNGILSLGDMAVSFNNLIDERRDDLYQPLLDSDISVQRTCLMTVTFLILAGQIKVKGQLAQLSKLLVHDDPTIKEMTKLFFLELATKDNAIYNGFIDMVGGLNNDLKFNEDNFKSIVKYVSQFLKKDKHRLILIKKFNERLLKENNERIWKNLGFCIKELIRRDETGSSTKNGDNNNNNNVIINGADAGEKKVKKHEMYKEILEYIDNGFKNNKLAELNNSMKDADIKIENAKRGVDEEIEKMENRAKRRVNVISDVESDNDEEMVFSDAIETPEVDNNLEKEDEDIEMEEAE